MIHVIVSNFKREMLYMVRYLPNTLSELFIFYLVFLGLFLGIHLIGDPATVEQNTQLIIINYVFWYLILTVTQGLGWEISNEAGQGTLEQLYLTPYPLWVTLLSRMVSTIFINLLTVSILLVAAMLTSGQWLNIDLLSILPLFVLTIVGVFGVGYAVAGMTVVLKEVGHIMQLLQFFIMGLAFIPLTVAPFLKYGPFVFGLELIREIAIDGSSLSDIPMSSILFLFINSCLYFLLGVLIFNRCESLARRKGLFGHY